MPADFPEFEESNYDGVFGGVVYKGRNCIVIGMKELKSKVDATTGPHNAAINEFHAYYQRTHGGADPTWKGRNAKLMSDLVKAHGLPEITRRIRVLETTTTIWPLPPWDMPTFSQHFDKLSVAAPQPTTGRAEPLPASAYEADEGRAF